MAFNVSSRRGNTGQNGSKVRKNIWTEIVKTAREPGHYPAFYWISPKYWLIHDTVEASGMKRFKNMHIIRGLAAPGNRNWNCNGKMPLGIKGGTLISSIHFCWLLTMNRKNWIVSFCMQNKVHRLESSFQYCLCAINWKSIFIDRWPRNRPSASLDTWNQMFTMNFTNSIKNDCLFDIPKSMMGTCNAG